MIEAGVVIMAVGGTDNDAIDIAKGYIASHRFTGTDVRLVKGDGVVMVITKKPLETL